MDNSHQIPSFEIPRTAEKAPNSSSSIETAPETDVERTREILPAPVAHVDNASPLAPALGQNTATATLPTTQVSALTTDDAHIVADDTDVIEKEWVDRAKKIISLTSNDPYVEAKEMSKLKATYMKKRFNKDMPLATEKKV